MTGRFLVPSVTPILNVSSIPASLDWFAAVGWETRFLWRGDDDTEDDPGFACVGSGAPGISLPRNGQGSRDTRPSAHPFATSTGGAWMSWFLGSAAEVDALHAQA